MTMGHLDAEAIYDLLEGRLDAGQARSAEAHVWRCAECRALHQECAAGLEALTRYGRSDAPAPPGYWDAFWSRFPVAGDAPASRPARRFVPAVAAAASIALLAVGAGWTMGRVDSGDELASTESVRAVPAPAVIPVEAATPGWEDDVAALRRVSFTIGSVDPLSKGFALASMAQEP
jgi:hypothetical protein